MLAILSRLDRLNGLNWLNGLNGLDGLNGLYERGVGRLYEPELVVSSVKVVLYDWFAIFCLSAGDIEYACACVGLDDVGSIGPLSSSDTGELEPAAGVAVGIN